MGSWSMSILPRARQNQFAELPSRTWWSRMLRQKPAGRFRMWRRWGSDRLDCIARKSLEICERCRLWERPKNPVDGVGLFVKFRARLTDLEQQAYCIYCNGTLRLAANAFLL